MNDKPGLLLPVIGLLCALLLASLTVSGVLARLLLGFALLTGLAALALAWRERVNLRRSQARMDTIEAALNALPDAVIQLDAEGVPSYLNPAGEAMLGLEPGAGIDRDGGNAAWRLIDHESRSPLLEALLAAARKDGLARVPAGARLLNRHGLELEVEGVCQPLRGEPGPGPGFLLQLRDVTEEREWRRQQPDLWDRDPVSALPGRGYMENRLNRALINKRAGDLPMSYLYLTLSGIQAVYDDLGANAGDALIRHLTALLRAHVRDTDLIARMGSQAFGILLTYCPAEVSQRIANGVLAGLSDYRFEWEGQRYPIGSSLGHVDVPPFDGYLNDLLAAASRQS